MLTLVESRPWGTNGDLLLETQERLHGYLDVVEAGKIAEQYPNLAGKPIVLRIDSVHPLGPLEQKFFESVRVGRLQPLGIRIEFGRV
ncbi:MAG: hypothetical protein EPO68_07400 [Planctomycetota bacterium]|nr:MAG: hypothetical protein EPO68_07400 [Planctomycetota bacterium]